MKIKRGDIVRYTKVVDPGDDTARFVAMENAEPGERLDIRFIGHYTHGVFTPTTLTIPPINTVAANDLIIAEIALCVS